MKRVIVFLALTLCVWAPAARCGPAPIVGLRSFSANSDLSDRLITSALADSLAPIVFRKAWLVEAVPPSGQLGGGYYRQPNPLAESLMGATGIEVTMRAELEECTYQPPNESEKQIGAFWAFGLIGLMATSREHGVAGTVQWRGYMEWPGSDGPHVVLGRGVCIGDYRKLDRRTALLTANKRALYDLACSAAVELDDALKMGLKRKSASMSDQQFRVETDNW